MVKKTKKKTKLKTFRVEGTMSYEILIDAKSTTEAREKVENWDYNHNDLDTHDIEVESVEEVEDW